MYLFVFRDWVEDRVVRFGWVWDQVVFGWVLVGFERERERERER